MTILGPGFAVGSQIRNPEGQGCCAKQLRQCRAEGENRVGKGETDTRDRILKGKCLIHGNC
jgi:hypothetical protein